MSPTVFTVPNIPLLRVFLCRHVERRSWRISACVSDTRVGPISGSVYPRTIGMYAARLSLCACANENDREKECYAGVNERNDIYISKLHFKKKAELISGVWCCFCGAAPHIGVCMGNTRVMIVR